MALPYQRPEDEQDQGGMNVLNPQNQQTAQQGQQNQPMNVSGGQSASISEGQTQPQTQQPQQKKTKQASSGMYSNLNKYVQANQPAAQQMSQAAQQKFGQQAQNIGQSVQQQQQDFMSQVAANRARIQQAQQFGQQTLQKAGNQQSAEEMQARQQAMQTQLGRFGDLQEGGYQQNIQQYQSQQPQVQQAFQQAQQAQQAAQTPYDQLVNQLAQRAVGNISTGRQSYDRSSGYRDILYQDADEAAKALREGRITANQFVNDQQRQTFEAAKRYEDWMRATGGRGQYNGDILADYSATQQIMNDPNLLKAQETYNLAQQFDPTRQAYEQAQQQFKTAEQAQQELERNLFEAQENQRLYENRDAMQAELTALQEKMAAAPESVTPEEAQRFQNLLNGIERFDQVGFDIAAQKRQAGELSGLANDAERASIRSELLRRSIGGQDYTGGKAALDALILGSDDAARESLIRGVQEQSKGLQGQIRGAERESARSFAELAGEGRGLQEQLKSGLTSEQEALQKELEQRVQSGEGTLTARLRDALESGKGLSEEDMALLGLSADQRYYNLTDQELKDLAQYDPNKFTAQDVATMSDVARAKALASLAGREQDLFADEGLIRERTLSNIQGGLQNAEGQLNRGDASSLAQGDRETIAALQAKMQGKEQEYNQAKANVRNTVASSYGGELNPVADMITSLVQNGQTGWEFGTIDLNKILTGTKQEQLKEAAKIAHTNYWGWVGAAGRHGVSVDPNAIINAVHNAYSMNNQVMQQFTPNQAGNIALSTKARQDALKNLAKIR